MFNRLFVCLIIFSLVLIVSCATPPTITDHSPDLKVSAEDFERGAKAASLGDYKTAINYWEPLAKIGDKRAQHNLGVFYNEGLGVNQDFNQAFIYYQMAAQQGFMNSQNNIGTLYDQGKLGKVDYAQE